MQPIRRESSLKIPSPQDLRQQELATEAMRQREAVDSLNNEISLAADRMMKRVEQFFQDGKINSTGGRIRIDGLEGAVVDLFDEAHCALLQNAVNKLLNSTGWECEIYQATLEIYLYPAEVA